MLSYELLSELSTTSHGFHQLMDTSEVVWGTSKRQMKKERSTIEPAEREIHQLSASSKGQVLRFPQCLSGPSLPSTELVSNQ